MDEDRFDEKAWSLNSQLAICISSLLVHIAHTVVTKHRTNIRFTKISMLPFYANLIMAACMTVFFLIFIPYNFWSKN